MSLFPLGLLSQRGGAGATGFNLISTSLISTTTSSVTFSDIPASYTHLQLRIVARSTAATTLNNITLRLNGDTGSNYGYQSLKGDGSSGTSGYSSSYQTYGYVANMPGASASTGWCATIVDILDYKNTNKIKTMKTFGGNAGYLDVTMFNTLWNSTSAISSIVVADHSGSASFAAGTRISLYGVGS